MNTETILKGTSIIVVTHEYATGPPHALIRYLKGKTKKLVFIAHPFVFAKDTRSHFDRYDDFGEKTVSSKFPTFVRNQFISALKDVVVTIFWTIRHRPFDLFIGVDGINACTGLFLRRLGIVQRVVFYTIDYVPERHGNMVLNCLYHAIDTWAVKGADTVWNLAETMVSMREKKGLDKSYRAKQTVVPVGTESGVLLLSPKKIVIRLFIWDT